MRQTGLVLLTTIIMISILTLLVLSLMQSMLLYLKAHNQVLIKHEVLYQLEAAAYQIAKETYSSDCVLTNENPNRMLELLLSKRGCVFMEENRQYLYLIDDLGLFPCLQIKSGNEIQSSHHWLITVISSTSQHTALQLRVVKLTQAIACKAAEIRWIKKGVVSWRYLSHL